MRLYAQLRGSLTTLAVAFLLVSLMPSECFGCDSKVTRSQEPGQCCNPDGRCHSSSHKVPPPRCLEAHSGAASVGEPAVQIHPAPAAAVLPTAAKVVPVRESEMRAAAGAECCPPSHPILHSVLLI